ncbi:hypothetical protein LCGC14_2708040 [marine sediment metagenome]|uniref:Uncharacterized protein n=1 Tax=marine sediment metagenome TaxID=412755 RepID=A0A0F8ZDR5_9ZZZZ
MAASKLIGMMGGDPEGDVASEAALYQGLSAMQQSMPLHRMRQRLESEEEMAGAQEGYASDFASEAREVSLGRRVTSPRELLESVSQKMGTNPEELGRRLSPTRMGDYSSLSRAAFGRSPKKMGPPQNG